MYGVGVVRRRKQGGEGGEKVGKEGEKEMGKRRGGRGRGEET